MNPNLLRFDKKKIFLLLDTETEALGSHHSINKPWQIAFLKIKNSEIVNSLNIYIDWPDLKMGAGAIAVTGWHEGMTKGQTKPEDAAIQTVKMITGEDDGMPADFLCGHNFLFFDYYCLRSMFSKLGMDFTFLSKYKVLDTYALAKGLAMNRPINENEDLMRYQYKLLNTRVRLQKLTLSALAKSYKIEVDESQTHTANYDLQLNFEVLKQLLYKVEI